MVSGAFIRAKHCLMYAVVLWLILLPVICQAAVNMVDSLIYTNAARAYWPAVGYNAYSDEHMALWVDVGSAYGWQLKGQRINAEMGTLAGAEFYVADNPAGIHALIGAVAYNSINHEWFVVYQAGIVEVMRIFTASVTAAVVVRWGGILA